MTSPIGFFHIDITEVRTEEGKLHLFVAIDRTSKFAFAKLYSRATMQNAKGFLLIFLTTELKAMMRISKHGWRYREKMVGANLHKDLSKPSRSCEPNGLFQVDFNAMRAS